MSLKAILTSDVTGFLTGINKAKGAADSLNSVFAKVGAGIGAYLSVEGIKSLTTNLAGIGEAADRVGLGDKVEEFQALTYAAMQSGAGMENVEVGMKKMLDTIGGAMNGDDAAQKKINGIGLAVADLAGMSPDKQFDAVAAAIAGIQDPAQRTAAAIDIFGKSGTMLLPMLENLQSLKAEAVAVGAVIDAELITAAKTAEDQFRTLGNIMLATAANSGLITYLQEVSSSLMAVATNASRAAAAGGRKSGGGGWMENTKNWLEDTLGSDKETRYDVTDAEKKKLAEFKVKKEAAGGKTKTEIKAEETAAQKKRVAEESGAKLAAKNAKTIDEKIAALQADVDLQDAKNRGLEIEGQRLKSIADLQKQVGRELTAQEQSKINAIYAQKQSIKTAENEKEAGKTIKDEALKLRDKMLEKSGTTTLADAMQRSIEGKTGAPLSADNAARLQELAGIQQAMTYQDAIAKFSLPEIQTQTNDLARVGGFAGSVAAPKSDELNQRIASNTQAQVDLLKKANELIAKIGELK
jgi:hypothetical protein